MQGRGPQGSSGVGKTHLANAIGQLACLRSHRVRFTTAADLVNDLVSAQARNGLHRRLGSLAFSRYLAALRAAKPPRVPVASSRHGRRHLQVGAGAVSRAGDCVRPSSTYPNTRGTTMLASLSMTNFGVSTSSLPHVIFLVGTAPEYEP